MTAPVDRVTALDWLEIAAAARERAGLARPLRPRAAGDGILDLASNDYLGLGQHPEVVEAAEAAVRRWGAGSTGSRLVTGSTALHQELEDALADFCGAEAGLVFSSGYTANIGAITALADPDTLIVSDASNHASIVDGCRLSRARTVIAPHLDVSSVERALSARTQTRALVVTDAVFSTDGDLAPLAALHEVTRRHGALLLIDEAHGLGVRGRGGRGLTHEHGLAAEPDVVRTVTLSKSLGSQGGAVLGGRLVIEHLVNTARSFIFDTGLAPAAAGAALAALQVLRREPQRAVAVLARADRLAAMTGAPVPTSAVVSVILRRNEVAVAAAQACLERGVRGGLLPAAVGPTWYGQVAAHGPSYADRCRPGPGAGRVRTAVAAAVSEPSGPPPLLVVTGTGTEVGKTIVTAAVAALAAEAGRTVAVLKAAQTGLGPGEPGDVHEVGRLSGVTDLHELARYPEPLAPATAARRSGMRQVRVVDVVKYAEGLSSRDLVLVEGAGGSLVHLDKAGGTLLDAAARLNAPVLLVSSAGLGNLNLLALNAEAFAARGLTCLGVVIGAWPREPDLASRTNLADFSSYAKLPLLGVIPQGASQLSRRIFLSVARSGLAPVLGGTFDAAAFRSKVGADATQVTRRGRTK